MRTKNGRLARMRRRRQLWMITNHKLNEYLLSALSLLWRRPTQKLSTRRSQMRFRMLSKSQFILNASLILVVTGCGTTAILEKTPRPPLPVNLTQDCPALPQLPKPGTMGQMLQNHVEITQMYYECADLKKSLVESVK